MACTITKTIISIAKHFPRKSHGKRICRQSVMSYEQTKWLLRMQSCDDFLRFREINQTLVPSVIWKTALDQPKTLESMTFLAKVTCKPPLSDPSICMNCEVQYRDELYHKLFECGCESLETIITSYWTNTNSQFSGNFFTFLKKL